MGRGGRDTVGRREREIQWGGGREIQWGRGERDAVGRREREIQWGGGRDTVGRREREIQWGRRERDAVGRRDREIQWGSRLFMKGERLSLLFPPPPTPLKLD